MLKWGGESHKMLAFIIPGKQSANIPFFQPPALIKHFRARVEFSSKNRCTFYNPNSLDEPKSPEASDSLSRKGKYHMVTY